MIRATLAVCVVIACARAFGLGQPVERCEAADTTVLREMIVAKTIRANGEVRSRVPRGNVVFDAVAALRRYELSATSHSREMLLQSVPRSTVEVAALYHLTYPGCVTKERPDLFVDYLQAVYNVVRRSRRNYPTLLRLPVLAQGGDLGAALSGLVDRLYAEDSKGFMKVMGAMPQSERELICGDEIPCP